MAKHIFLDSLHKTEEDGCKFFWVSIYLDQKNLIKQCHNQNLIAKCYLNIFENLLIHIVIIRFLL